MTGNRDIESMWRRAAGVLTRNDRVVIVLAALFFAQGFFGSLDKSLTFDEPTLIGAGYNSLVRGDFRLNPSNPPLMEQLEALPLLFMEIVDPVTADSTVLVKGNPWTTYGRRLLFESGNDPVRIGRWARIPVLLLGVGLIMALYAWAKQLGGQRVATVAATLAAFSPNLLAHAKVATADMGVTALMLVAVWTFSRSLENNRHIDWAVCGIATGFALVAKYTALLLGPIFVIIGALELARRRDSDSVKKLLRGAAFVAAGVVVAIAITYQFSPDAMRYVQGLGEIYGDHYSDQSTYILGRWVDGPRWYYTLAASLVKVPIPTMALLGLGGWWLARRSRRPDIAAYLLVPPAVVIGASFFDASNLGFRRILPALPFLLLLAAFAALNVPHRAHRWVVGLALTWTIVNAIRIYPHHLSYFNEMAGGPTRGPQLLDDSNIDWGQDLPALAAWQRAQPEEETLKLWYRGTSVPEWYGVRAAQISTLDLERPGPGAYAISAHNLVALRRWSAKIDTPEIDWLRRYQPAARAGYSIYIYRFP